MSRTNASVAEHVLFVKGPPRRHAEKPWRSLGCSTPQPVPTGPARGVPGPKWLRAVQAHPATASLRVDAHRNLLGVVWALAVDARPDGTSMPTWAALVEQTGLGRRTVARWLAFLGEHGLLRVLETGSTPATRPAWHPVQGNRAALYVLLTPFVDQSGTPPVTHVVSNPNAREAVADRPAASGGRAVEPRVWPRMRVTATKADRLRARGGVPQAGSLTGGRLPSETLLAGSATASGCGRAIRHAQACSRNLPPRAPSKQTDGKRNTRRLPPRQCRQGSALRTRKPGLHWRGYREGALREQDRTAKEFFVRLTARGEGCGTVGLARRLRKHTGTGKT